MLDRVGGRRNFEAAFAVGDEQQRFWKPRIGAATGSYPSMAEQGGGWTCMLAAGWVRICMMVPTSTANNEQNLSITYSLRF
ncbi:hypothetical protein BDV29DRAFT_178787 [Aspergillus leporis]|jgi:hypothetical protein|uniref:Uncharacterized protein n=1 Tax=Aspergillus leporis TaxID=41062 RepID=A0A5N5WTN1_9EURO|nr:hypothetical protein BDV29DRAFT_178787 [Aspergillus leporis]